MTKKLNHQQAVVAAVVGRTADEDKTMEEALEPDILSRSE
jgi:hypothetical protein